MKENDTQKLRITQSMDELLVKTIGIMETLPDRLTNLENQLRSLETKFAKHEGEQKEGIAKTVEELKKSFEECKKTKVSSSLSKQIEDLDTRIAELEESVKPLIDVYQEREETKKTITQYIKDAFKAGLGYAMLPITIIILLFFGLDPKYIPWYKEPEPVVVTRAVDAINDFWQCVYENEIQEDDLRDLISKYKECFIVSYSDSSNKLDIEYQERLSRTNLKNQEHMFVWLPKQSQDGFVQVYDKNGRCVGVRIRVSRG